ncbi:MAG: manganese efflux pump [Eubacteriales bacterium]|jgi:putative Mn2+ efflux pump MntP
MIMALWQILLISIGLSLDVFAYCLYKGAMISTIDIPNLTKMTAIFTGFQAGMMVIGCGITRIPALVRHSGPFGRFWALLAVCLFFLIGIIMIVKSFTKQKKKIEEKKQDTYNFKVIVFWAFLTSIDALLAGIGFGFLGLRLIGMALLMAVITAASAIVGLVCGYRLGCGPMNRLVAIGGCMVLVGAVDLLVNCITGIF